MLAKVAAECALDRMISSRHTADVTRAASDTAWKVRTTREEKRDLENRRSRIEYKKNIDAAARTHYLTRSLELKEKQERIKYLKGAAKK